MNYKDKITASEARDIVNEVTKEDVVANELICLTYSAIRDSVRQYGNTDVTMNFGEVNKSQYVTMAVMDIVKEELESAGYDVSVNWGQERLFVNW